MIWNKIKETKFTENDFFLVLVFKENLVLIEENFVWNLIPHKTFLEAQCLCASRIGKYPRYSWTYLIYWFVNVGE